MARFSKICKCCNLPFETNSPQKLFCDRPHYLPCPVCGKPVLKKDRDFTRDPVCCSVQCTVEKNRLHLPVKKCEICGEEFKPKSGVATICEREHHGKCVICGNDMIITKRIWHDKIDTCSRKCAKEKMRRFYQEKYGVDHPMQNSEVQEHHRAAMKSKYGVEHALQCKEIMEATYETNLSKFGTKYACLRPECQSLSPVPIVSSLNKKFGQLLSNVGLSITYEKIVDSRAFDIFIENTNILIEIDPTYTHNSHYNHWNSPLKPDYHKIKTDVAKANGFRCIHVFEWDAKEKIIDIVRPKTKISARKCEVIEVNKKQTDEFLRKYHIQKSVNNQTYRLGLFYSGELVQVMTFGHPRYDKRYDIELLRLCTKSGLSIVGGAEKLFKHSLQNNPSWSSIISYCDLAKFTGDVYTRLNMKLKRTTPPQAVWSKGTEKVTSMLLRQKGYDQLFKTNYGKGTSNEQLMLENGWLPVYDCGQAVYEYEVNGHEKM